MSFNQSTDTSRNSSTAGGNVASVPAEAMNAAQQLLQTLPASLTRIAQADLRVAAAIGKGSCKCYFYLHKFSR